jgi:hypothetical protein
MPSLAQDFWISTSCAFNAPGGLKMPSGALLMPSTEPVTPMNRSALS